MVVASILGLWACVALFLAADTLAHIYQGIDPVTFRIWRSVKFITAMALILSVTGLLGWS